MAHTDLKWLKQKKEFSVLASTGIEVIESLDLEKVKESVRAELPEGVDVDELEREFKRFLALHLLAVEGEGPEPEVVGPSALVDVLWHAFILDTPNYVDSTNRIFGRYLHHVAQEPSSDEAMRETLEDYFSDVDVDRIWKGPIGDCNPPRRFR